MIRFGENVGGPSMCFKYRAMQWFNSVPVEVRIGSLETIKKKLKPWVKQNVPIDWG